MRKKLVWLLLSGLLVAALLVASCAPGATKAEEVAPAAEEVVAEEEGVVGEFIGPFRVGETAQTDKLAVTVTAIWLADSYDYYSASLDKMITRPSGAGTAYLFANIKIKNLGSVSSYDLPLVGAHGSRVGLPEKIRGGYTGGSHQTAEYTGEGALPVLGGKLAPGEEVEGKALFIIPSGKTGHWVEYRLQVDPAIWARWLLE